MAVGLGLTSLSRWLRIQVFGRPRITILCYHRITAYGGLISPQCIPPAMFEEQMRHLTGHYRILTLDQVAEYLRGELELLEDAIVVTFDDGYQDNYTDALPILSRHGVVACFFVASAPLLAGEHYWIDTLSARLEALHGTDATISLPAMPEIAQQINGFIAAPVQDRQLQAKSVFLALNQLKEPQKHTVLAALHAVCQVTGAKTINTPSLMTAEQLTAMTQAGQQIGAHTVSHPRLSNLVPKEVASEITNGIMQLRQSIAGVRHFAYPFGKLADIPTDRAALFATLKTADVALAVTTEDGVVEHGDSAYLVPRTVMSPQSLAETRLKLERLAWKRCRHV